MKNTCESDEHDWCFKKDWKSTIEIEDGFVRIPVKCSICKLEAFEIYEQTGYEDKEGEEL